MTIIVYGREPEWMAEVKRIAGDRWDWWCAWYSFHSAFESGMTPEEAARDCDLWICAYRT